MEKGREIRWCIIKFIEQSKFTANNEKIELPSLCVVILDAHGEVWEFDEEEEAENMREIFSTNSDSGHTYKIKKI